jgi:hypothetical protein
MVIVEIVNNHLMNENEAPFPATKGMESIEGCIRDSPKYSL